MEDRIFIPTAASTTPDMLPGDVRGHCVRAQHSRFEFPPRPVFANSAADEINRTGPKVQAAFLECMAEKQVTIDNVTYPLDDLFFVGHAEPARHRRHIPLPLVQRTVLLKIRCRTSTPPPRSRSPDHAEIQRSAQHVTRVHAQQVLLARRRNRVHVSPPCAERSWISSRPRVTTRCCSTVPDARRLDAAGRDQGLGARTAAYSNEDDLKHMAPYVPCTDCAFTAARRAGGSAADPMAPHLETLVRGGL